MILLENLFGEAAVLNDQDAVSLPQAPSEMELVLGHQTWSAACRGGLNLVSQRKGLGLLYLHPQKGLTASYHHALIVSLYQVCLKGLCQRTPPEIKNKNKNKIEKGVETSTTTHQVISSIAIYNKQVD